MSSAAGIVVSGALLVLVLIVPVVVSVVLAHVCVVFVMVSEDVVEVRHGV